MIFKALFDIILGLLDFLISLFPDYGYSLVNVTNAFDSLMPYFKTANAFLPLATLLTILQIFISIKLSIMLWRIANWFYNKVRGSGS